MTQKFDVLVLGAGIVGVCTALHLQLRGRRTALLDRADPGMGTSYGNAGLIQNEAVMPYLFPRALGDILRYAGNRSIDAAYQPAALPGLAGSFFRYWRNSRPDRAIAIARARAPLFGRCIEDHRELATAAGACDQLRSTGWSKVFYTSARLDAAIKEAQREAEGLGVPYVAMDATALARHEPDLAGDLIGGDPLAGAAIRPRSPRPDESLCGPFRA